jgi:hypothetical protein
MTKISKTAKASEVKETKAEKRTLSDAELVRLLRIDRESGLYPGTQGVDAMIRLYDRAFLDAQVMDSKILAFESVNSAAQLEAIDHDLSAILGERAEDDVTSVLARVQLALRKVRYDIKEAAARIVKTTNVIHGDQNAAYAAPSADAEELSAAVQAL